MTSAHHADHGLLLARTDLGCAKYEGLSYFVIDIKQPGDFQLSANSHSIVIHLAQTR